MGETDLEETVWRRATCDFRLVLGTVWFWLLDAGGAAVVGALLESPFWGVVWFFCIFGGTLAFLAARAPLIQRNDARGECRKLQKELSPPGSKYESWIDMETAAQHFYDHATSPSYDKTGEMAQALKNIGTASDGTLWPCVEHFFLEGIRQEKIKARGHKEQSGKVHSIPSKVSRGVRDITDGVITDAEDMDWTITEIYLPSIDEYLRWIQNDKP